MERLSRAAIEYLKAVHEYGRADPRTRDDGPAGERKRAALLKLLAERVEDPEAFLAAVPERHGARWTWER